ncbi:MAG: DNA-binding response regulator [Candidatus Rokuibacteriota bacterium]|nr:MAG: DNA-binding response regulator [Candidatus Rokubacteria bacterium]
MSTIRIVIADDHQVVRHGLRLSLELEPDMVVVGEARSGAEAIRVAEEKRPDVTLLDVKFGDELDGPEVCRRILLASPKTAIVMLTNYQQDTLILRSLLAGAKGYVIKDVELEELKKMIRSVYRGAAVLDPKVTGQVISSMVGRTPLSGSGQSPARPAGSLSETDLSIIRFLSVGLTNKEIGVRINLSPHTVKDHVEKISDLMGVRSRVEIVAEALRRGLI